MQKISKDLTAATSIPLVMAILARGESYGYEIIRQVQVLSKDEIHWTEGMLYPVLHKLENQGYIHSDWRIAPDTGRKRRYYRLSPEGLKQLTAEQQQWQFMNQLLAQLWPTQTTSI